MNINTFRTWLSRYGLAFFFVMAGGLLLYLASRPSPPSSPQPTYTPEPIIPTQRPATLPTAATNKPTVPTIPAVRATAVVPPPNIPITNIPPTQRFGVAVPESKYFQLAQQAGLQFGSYLNWWPALDLEEDGQPPLYWRMVRLQEDGLRNTTWAELAELVPAHPGSFWMVGNEMDVRWQDNVTPPQYAAHYHEVYTFIKDIDPTAKVGLGGVSQPTPLRLAYLDLVLETYRATHGRPLPTDFWNVHTFILREEAESWGVGIPPGMDGQAELGILYELDAHTNPEIFAQNLINFRVWMAERGYQNRPLVVTEYGILMPPDFGYPPEVVAAFLEDTLDFFTTAQHPTIGYPADDNRLVQWWFWYGIHENDSRYATGNLYDDETGKLTPAGILFSQYPR